MLLISSCSLTTDNIIPSTEAMPSTEIPTVQPTISDSEWQQLAPGLEQRAYTPNDNPLAQIIVLRIDPNMYTFRAHYRAGSPLGLGEWESTLSDAVALVNANFFDPQNRVLGLLVSDGMVYGSSYFGRGGTFVIQNGQARVRSNLVEPYQGEALEQAVQAFPMLVLDGVSIFEDLSATSTSRRTIVAQDIQGRILLMVTPFLGLLLTELSVYLPTTDMGIVNAVNLDGGGSTMMFVAPSNFRLPSLDPVPSVLAVYPR